MRAVIVVDRGWIFAGDVERRDDRIFLKRCVWVFLWREIGFNGVIKDPKQADIRPMADIEIPAMSEIFLVPVDDDWGMHVYD